MKNSEKVSQQKTKKKVTIAHCIWTVVGVILCIILVPMLILNLTLIVKSYTNSSEVPSVGGYLPMIVLTDSMYPNIQSGDLIICHTVDPEEVEIGDTIAFFDPAGNGTSVVTHQVIDVVKEEGELQFQTKGINNNAADASLVPADNLVGEFQFRIAGAGNIAMFFQTTTGLIVCVVIPLILLVAYDIVRRRMYEKSKKQDTAALLAELEALRAQSAGEESSKQSPE
jgi:signal peptidase